jgi:hypothetical protein
MNIKPRYTSEWSPSRISFIIKKHCYTGHHVYNKAAYVPNPKKPIGDVTYAIRRAVRQLKPENEWAQFEIPPLISEKQWELANQNLNERGRGRGKEGSREALLRGRIFCPSCNQLMTIYQDTNYKNLSYYICSSRSQGWKRKRCHIHSLRIERTDNAVWDCVYALLQQPDFLEYELQKQDAGENNDELQKRIRLEQQKMEHSLYKIRRIQEGYEADPPVYTATEVQEKIGHYRDMIYQAEKETNRLQGIMQQKTLDEKTREDAIHLLESLRDTNLEEASFDEKRDLLARLGIKVYPSDDSKNLKIITALRLKLPPQIMSIASPKL